MIRKIREKSEIPIILFSYYNPILAFSLEAFYQEIIDTGVDGVLVVDLPPEESDELTRTWKNTNEPALIRLIAPTTPVDRMKQIAGTASGFLYLVSKTGVTGSAGLDLTEVERTLHSLRSVTDVPVSVGFGISTAEDVRAVAGFADGVVIGSAFERLIEQNLDRPNLASILGERVREYKAATKSNRD